MLCPILLQQFPEALGQVEITMSLFAGKESHDHHPPVFQRFALRDPTEGAEADGFENLWRGNGGDPLAAVEEIRFSESDLAFLAQSLPFAVQVFHFHPPSGASGSELLLWMAEAQREFFPEPEIQFTGAEKTSVQILQFPAGVDPHRGTGLQGR